MKKILALKTFILLALVLPFSATIAEETNLNRQNLYRIFANQTSPRFDTLTKILRALGYTFALKTFNVSQQCV